jgi:hypothetical protein
MWLTARRRAGGRRGPRCGSDPGDVSGVSVRRTRQRGRVPDVIPEDSGSKGTPERARRSVILARRRLAPGSPALAAGRGYGHPAQGVSLVCIQKARGFEALAPQRGFPRFSEVWFSRFERSFVSGISGIPDKRAEACRVAVG